MKTQFKSDEIAHIWAHQSAPHGSSPGAMSFNGPAFLSYGTEIGRIIEHKGKKAVIYNETPYSVSTSKHQGCVRRAIAGMQIFHIGDIGRGCSLRFDAPEKNLFEYAVEQAKHCAAKAEKAKGKKEYWESLQSGWLNKAMEVSAFFGLRRKVDEKTIQRLTAAAAKAQRKQAKEQAIRLAKQREEQQDAFAAWLRGEDGGYFSHSAFPVAFRVEVGELVSTLGARVQLDEARLAFRFAQKHRATGWHRNGSTFAVGNYQLDAINAQGIVAGCHRISWKEIERLAPVLA